MSLPRSFRKVQVQKLSANFREATAIVTDEFREVKPNEVLLRNHWVGVNASDINFTAGKYLLGVKPPFDAGFESIGEVVQVGSQVSHLKPGDFAATTAFGSFAEYQYTKGKNCVPVPELSPRMLPLLVSGLTASLALEQVGHMSNNEVVLVTAAAGGTGCFAVQLAKLANNHVIGTCSSDEKVALLKSLGCDRVVNYKKESLDEVLTREYPKGVDIVYESVGGSMYETCFKHLAVRGRLIIIGMISSYQDQSVWKGSNANMSPMHLLQKSASIQGFFLNHFLQEAPRHMANLAQLVVSNQLNSVVDQTLFKGLEQIPQAIDHMYSGKNQGKVVVQVFSKSNL